MNNDVMGKEEFTEYIKVLREKLWAKLIGSKSPRAVSRYEHSLEVALMAERIARNYSADELFIQKAIISGLIHDYAKFTTFEEYQRYIDKYHLDIVLSDNEKKIYHGLIGYLIVKEELNITDNDILNSICNHVMGKPNMSLLEKIIFVADYVEETRGNEEYFDKVRKAAFENIDKAVALETENIISHLQDKGDYIHPISYETYNYYKKYLD